MATIRSYDSEIDVLTYDCDCGLTNRVDCSGFHSSFNEMYGEYDNFNHDCECGAMTVFNMNIPFDEFEELDFEFFYMPFSEINTRKYVRDFMWTKREDLESVDREAYYKASYNRLRQ